MTLRAKAGLALRFALLGPPGPREAVDLPLQCPQSEVAVWLHGLGAPRDVTACHSVACPIPFTLCIGFEDNQPGPGAHPQRVLLRFRQQTGNRRLLGEIELQYEDMIPTAGPRLGLYKATACTNFCLPPLRRWTRSLYMTRERWKNRHSGRLRPSLLDSRCNEVVFICPRPVVLVSLLQGNEGNIFPMNLMGQVGTDHFVFALNRNNQAAPRVGSLAQVALSTIPFEHAEQVRQLGRNHHKSSIDFAQLSFSTHPSPTLGIPVPDFALTVREMKLEKMLPLGSHTFFIARIVSRHVYSTSSSEFYRIHGLYAARRTNEDQPPVFRKGSGA